MDALLLKLTQFEKIRLIGKTFFRKKSRFKPRKIKTQREQISRLLPEKKKISKTYIRVLTTFITLKKHSKLIVRTDL